MTKGECMATERRNPSPGVVSAPDSGALSISAQPPLARGELLSLLQRLSVELDAFLDDLDIRREPSRNRESSRQP
jgi:hypothetical protein